MRSKIWSKLIFSSFCFILRSHVLRIAIRVVLGLGDCAGGARGEGVGGQGGGGAKVNYVVDIYTS